MASWQGLVCELDESGFAVSDSTGRTSASGVWVAGNAVDPRAPVISAAGAGAAAAIAINADLVEEDIANAVEAAACVRRGLCNPVQPERIVAEL